MKKCWVIIFFCFPLLADAQQSKEEAEVSALSRRKFNWLIHKDYDSIRIMVDDRVQYIHSNGWVENKTELIEDLKSGKLNYQKVTVKESAVRIYPTRGNGTRTAIVTGIGTFEGITEGKPFSMDLRYTEVYINDQSKIWKLVSRHANRMP